MVHVTSSSVLYEPVVPASAQISFGSRGTAGVAAVVVVVVVALVVAVVGTVVVETVVGPSAGHPGGITVEQNFASGSKNCPAEQLLSRPFNGSP